MFLLRANQELSGSRSNVGHSAGRLVILFTTAALIGLLGWSGVARVSWISLLYPFVYLQSRSRLEALSAMFYYAGATWSVIPGAAVFFGTNANFALPLLLFLGCIALGSVPWILLYHRRFTEVSAIAALAVLALPPLSFVTVAHPLISAGQWFPATRWLGILLPLLTILLNRWFGPRYTAGILLASFFVTHIRWIPPAADPHIAAIDTHFGGTGFVPRSPSVLYQQERLIQSEALRHPYSVVLFPETIVPAWSGMTDAHWSDTFRALEQQRTTLLLGTTVPVPATEGSRNILLTRGFGPHFAYVQRIPVPLAMWHFGGREGFPLMLHYPDRSALVFAPNPKQSDDGLLQVRDIRKMHLNAKLVTLSACNTGVGPVGEDGVANLVNAFIEAGADSVISTLWELEDHSTSRMMTDFYRHVAMHEPEAEALRDAQLGLIKDNAPPYYWASFQLVGNPDTTL